MKEIMKIESREQAELIADPICLSIINLMEDHALTKKEVAQQLEEDFTLVDKYIDRLEKNDLIEKTSDNNKVKYRKSAESYELGSWSRNFDGNIYNHWILGLIHHLESNITDILKILPDDQDTEDFLNDLGYEDTSFRLNKLFLTRDEAREFQNMVTDFVKKHNKRPESELKDKRPYELALILNPDLPFLKKKVEDDNN